MTTSSARPDALDAAADGLRTSSSRLHDAARSMWAAADAYRELCPDRPLDLVSPSRVGAALADARDLCTDLRHVATAFRSADGGGGGGLAASTDLALSNSILVHHPSLGRELTGPSRAVGERGVALAEAVLRTTRTSGAERAMTLLSRVPADVAADPLFAAAFLNRLGPDHLGSITEELAARAGDWRSRFGPLFDLARLWTAGTRSLDLPPRAARLDHSLIDSLLASASGRNVLRALTGGSDQPAGESYIRRVVLPLATMGATRDAALSNTYRFLLGPGRQGDPDAPMIDATSRAPDVAVDAFLWPVTRSGASDLEAQTTTLLSAGAAAQPAVAALLARVLADERLDPATNSRDRTAVLRATYTWVRANGPGSVTEPLAQLLADTIATDIDFYLGRTDSARSVELSKVLQGVTEFERPWMTALLAFEHHGVQLVQQTLHQGADAHFGALHQLGRLEQNFEAAAQETDRPVDRASAFFGGLGFVADAAVGAVKLHPVASIIAKETTQRAIDAWHASTIEDPDDHEARTIRAREGLRRRIWTVIAADPELGRQVEWSVGGGGSDRHHQLGSRIDSPAALVALTSSDADLDELAGWASAQPPELRAVVDSYMAGAL